MFDKIDGGIGIKLITSSQGNDSRAFFHDDRNPAAQNFKLVSWESVAVRFSPPFENH